MLRPDEVNPQALELVATDIGELITSPPSMNIESLTDQPEAAPAPASYDMTETFAVWVLHYDDLMKQDGYKSSASDLPKPTSRWHHQVRRDGKVIGYARSVDSEFDALALRQLFDSEVAANIDNAITLLDQIENADSVFKETDWIVRLLIVPAYQVNAFWLVDNDSDQSLVLLIDAPPQLGSLSRKDLISLDSFVAILQQLQPATGLTATLNDFEYNSE